MITGVIKLFFRLLFLPVRVVLILLRSTMRLGVGTFKLGVGTGKATTKATARTARGVGISRIVFFLLGVGVGYLLGSPAARQQLTAAVQNFSGGAGGPLGQGTATTDITKPYQAR